MRLLPRLRSSCDNIRDSIERIVAHSLTALRTRTEPGAIAHEIDPQTTRLRAIDCNRYIDCNTVTRFARALSAKEQNVALADVRRADLFELWQAARAAGLATPNIGLLTDIICCPGGDFCSLANARSIPVADAIQRRFDDLDYQHDIGEIDLNISGCMNSCGHHHVGHIGILGVDKNGEEWYQVSLGGSQGNRASIGKVIGRSFAAAEMPGVIAKIIDVYLAQRQAGERFIETVRRTGLDPFKLGVYGDAAVKERKQNA